VIPGHWGTPSQLDQAVGFQIRFGADLPAGAAHGQPLGFLHSQFLPSTPSLPVRSGNNSNRFKQIPAIMAMRLLSAAVNIDEPSHELERLTAGKVMDLTEEEIGRLLGVIAARAPRSAAEHAMQMLYENFSLTVRNYVWKNWTQDTQLIEELVQDTLFEVWRQPERFRGESRFKTWLLGIARHKTVDRLRKYRPVEELTENVEETLAADQPTITDVIAIEQIRASLQICMESLAATGRLSSAHREILHLAYVEDLDIAEMARIVQCPVNTVKTRLHHARLRIKNCMSRRLKGECHDD